MVLPNQKGADLEAGRVTGQKVTAQVVQGQATVHDVLNEDDVATGQVEVQVFNDPHHPGRPGGVAVGGHGHEVKLDRQIDGSGQVTHEHEGALEYPDQQRGPTGVVGGDLLAQGPDPGLEVFFGDQ